MKPPTSVPRLDLYDFTRDDDDYYIGSIVLDGRGHAVPTNEAAARRMDWINVYGRPTPSEPTDPLSPADGARYPFWLDVHHWHCSYIASGFREGPEGHPCPEERHLRWSPRARCVRDEQPRRNAAGVQRGRPSRTRGERARERAVCRAALAEPS